MSVGKAAWYERKSQTESLFNTHDLRRNGVIVEDVSKRDGGNQQLIVNGVEIPLDFID